MSNIQETRGILANVIIEVLGRPKEHLIETLEGIIDQISKEQGVRVISKKINEPVVAKQNKEFFTTFTELELELEEIFNLVAIVFKYMPAHVEVISPEAIVLTNSGWGDILSEITRKLHSYDEITNVFRIQNAGLRKQLMEAKGEKVEDIDVKENTEDKKSE